MLKRERDDDRDMMEDEDELEEILEEEDEARRLGSLSTFFVGVLVGALVGAGAALLVAPQRGEVTRKRLRRRLQDFGSEAADQLDEWKGDAQRELRRQRRRLKRRLPTH